jgi:1,4-alpha-glucan branching enzyme
LLSLGLTGNFTQILSVSNDATDKVVVFRRSTSSSDPGMVVVLNFYQKSYNNFVLQNMPANGNWNVVFNGDLTKYSSLYSNFGASQTSVSVSNNQGSLMLPQASAVILSMK